jgi:thiol:disulfide interchange protein DsbC
MTTTRALTLVVAMVFGGTAPSFNAVAAGTADTSPPLAPAAVLTILQTRYPATHFDSVKVSPLPGLFEVTMGKNIAYVEPSGRYFLFGHLYDMPGNRDLTADAGPADSASPPRSADWSSLPVEDAFLLQAGRGGKTLALFSDPQCGYCRQLEATLAAMPELTVRLYPLPQLAGSEPLVTQIWCATDRAGEWKATSRAPHATVARRACDTGALFRNRVLAQRLGIRGTPTLVAMDGRMLPGAVDAIALRRWLAEVPTHAQMEVSPQ